MTGVSARDILRLAWLFLVLGGLAYYVYRHGDEILTTVRQIGPSAIALAAIAAMLGKFFVALQMKRTLGLMNVDLQGFEFLRLYSYPDLAKYIPGGLWGIVGRWGAYREKGIPAWVIAKAIAVEHAWLIGGSAAIGAAAYAGSLGGRALANRIGMDLSPSLVVAATASILFIWLTVVFGSIRLVAGGAASGNILTTLLVAAEQLIIWITFGLAFHVLLPVEASDLATAVGATAMAFAAGFVAVFAPAGIGIREGVLTVLLSAIIAPQTALASAVFFRVVLLISDIIFAAGVLVLSRASRMTR